MVLSSASDRPRDHPWWVHLRQKGVSSFVHNATVPPDFTAFAADTQNRVISNQCACAQSIATQLLGRIILTAEPAVKRSTLPLTPPAEYSISSALPTEKSIFYTRLASMFWASFAVLTISSLGSVASTTLKRFASGRVELPGPHPTSNSMPKDPPVEAW